MGDISSLIIIPAEISNDIYHKALDKLFIGCTVAVCEWISNIIHILLGMRLLIHAGINFNSW